MKRILFLLTVLCQGLHGAPGNVWHLPSATETKIATTMRSPVYEIKDSNTTIYQGFYKNNGAGGDQNGGTVYYRTVPRGGSPGAWQALALGFHLNYPNNTNIQDQFWKAVIPTSGIAANEVVQYYVKVTFSGASPEATYLFGSDGASQTTTTEATAQASPFSIRNRPGWIYHANNRTIAGNDLEVRAKTGYIGPDNSPASLDTCRFARCGHRHQHRRRHGLRWNRVGFKRQWQCRRLARHTVGCAQRPANRGHGEV
jgi:hypothetical protein